MKYCGILLLGIISLLSPFTLFSQEASDVNFPCLIYDCGGILIASGERQLFPCSSEGWIIPALPQDQINMIQAGSAVAPMYNTMTGGDSDEDNLFELYMYIKDNAGGWTYTYRIYESGGYHNYNQVFQAQDGLIPYAFGDTDGDGLPEVIGQWSFWVYVYESPAAGQLASNMVWQSPSMTNVTGYTAIGDLDQDGHGEIIHTANSFGSDNRLMIYESTGNNQYQQVYNELVSTNNLGTKAIADFDGDGLMEVAFSSGGGEVMVYESTGGNTVQRIFRDNMNTYNAYACEYAGDMDGNGHPEFLCGGSDSNQGWVTRIYEAEGNNQFIVRQEIIIWDNYFGVPGLTVGDFDHDGVDEFVIQTAQALHIYKWGGQSYVEEQVIPENFGFILHGIEAYDGDYDGYDEVFWLGIGDGGYWTNDTVILEDVAGMTPPNVLVSMIPDTLPIVIPPAGGTFGYTIEIANQDSVLHTADLKLYVVLPSGSEFIITELSGLQLNPGVNINRHRIQNVPVNAPAGNYIYRIQIGDLPDIVWSEDEFEFVKE